MIRTLYVGQQVQIVTGPADTKATGVLPVSSASCEVTKPIEAVSAFGRLGALALAQTNLTTCKSSVKAYLSQNPSAFGTGVINSGVTAGLLNYITGDAVNGRMTVISVSPNGFIMSGICSSIGVDMALGGFGTLDLSFDGIGQPSFGVLSSDATSIAPASNYTPISIVPVTTIYTSGNVTGFGCANSFKFSLDMPTDTLACLGEAPNGSQEAMTSLIATKPPYKATVTVEGFGIDISNSAGPDVAPPTLTDAFKLGFLGISLPAGIITSKSFNNAVGNANASYNFTMEDTTANFTDANA